MRFSHHAAPLKPDTILIQVCVNDLKTIPLFPKDRELIINDCKNNIRLLGFDESMIIAAIDEVNEYIMGLEGQNVRIFDSYALLKGEGRKIKPDYSRDWLHLNEQGYQYLNQALKEFL